MMTWPPTVPRPSFDAIIRAVEIDHQIHRTDFVGVSCKTACAVLARAVAGKLCQTTRGMSTPEIARAMGTRSHTPYTPRGNWAAVFMSTPAGEATHDRLVERLLM